ncbi:EF-hand domain-containing protein [Tritonibacter horizontis]|uniref:EF-hand domain-containing protein n=1 Tax=Tritonibacter horizontis TaxID=1768241 RepID=A0A132C1C7_9RHOB|nr:calcium-binding protein [Tritonibacter horizontis]KUP94353.1 hypothetical protein TRIHO_07680 [Tritonibacter horizontis]
MKNLTLTAAALAVFAAAPVMASNFAAAVDADGNGSLSLEELQIAFPELTEDTFLQIDADADGEASMEEVTAAQDAGLLVTNG